MDAEKLKNIVNKIEMPEEMQIRIIQECRSGILYADTHSTTLKRKKAAFMAVLSFLLLCLAAAMAAGCQGFFKDIYSWTGAVVGTRYEQASDEIRISAVTGKDGITIYADVVDPEIFPYRELEALGIENYRIIDSSGGIIAEGMHSGLFELIEGRAEIFIPLDKSSSEDCRLVISAFIGEKKADQPLRITGTWECGFLF